MASKGVTDKDRGDTDMRLPPPDSPERDRESHSADDSPDSEVLFNRNLSQRRSRSREMVNIGRSELNNLFEEMRQLRNEVDSMKNKANRTETEHRHHRDSCSDDDENGESAILDQHRGLLNTPPPVEDPHEDPEPHEVPSRGSIVPVNTDRRGQGDEGRMLQKPKKPATYSGKTGWREYLIHFEMVSEFNKWNDRTKAFELALSLRDDAQVTLSDLKPEERKNFKSIVAALTSRFEPEDQSELYRSELKNRFRKKDEPLTEFAQDIKRLVRLAYPNTDVDVRSTLARNAFEDSLGDPDMEWAVHQGKPLTIESAVKLALEFEAFRGSRRQQLHKVNKAPVRVQSEEDTGLKENKRETNNLNKRAKDFNKLCTFCGRRGHIEPECYSKRRQLQRQSEMNRKWSSQAQGNC